MSLFLVSQQLNKTHVGEPCIDNGSKLQSIGNDQQSTQAAYAQESMDQNRPLHRVHLVEPRFALPVKVVTETAGEDLQQRKGVGKTKTRQE